MRLMQILHKLFQLEGYELITELYRELLNREPDAEGLYHHAGQLASGVSKISIMEGMLSSAEARQLYDRRSPWPVDSNKPTAANLLHHLFAMGNKDYAYRLYAELLCREPDHAGYASHLSALRAGMSKMSLFLAILKSEECMALLRAPHGRIIAEKVLRHFLEQSGVNLLH